MSSPNHDESRPPTKRSRDESSHEEIKRYHSLYFTNGDIVLLSLPKDHVVTAFRVDKAFLSRHSPVFEGMLSLPSPDDVEKYDDVPLVRLQDKVEHLIPFLTALYDATSIPFKKHSYDTVSKGQGILKLSAKYEVEKLQKRIVDILSADWPCDLALWDIHEKEIATFRDKYISHDRGNLMLNSMDHILPEPCSTIRLARDCGILSVLPAAFYHLSRIPPSADLGAEWKADAEDDEEYWDYVSDGRR